MFLTAPAEIGNDREVCAGDEELKKRGLYGCFAGLLRLIIVLPVLLLVGRVALGQDSGTVMGRVLDQAGIPVGDAQIELTSEDGLVRIGVRSADDGSFGLGGIPPGRFGLRVDAPGFTPSSCQGVACEPMAILFVKIRLAAMAASSGPGPPFVWIDLSDHTSRTLIDAFQIQSMPSANNIWSLIENQDFSATANRIDVGGVWADQPALWSSRGSVSWTQSSYLINGIEATDPYITGMPLFYPDLEAWQFVSHSNGRHPVADLSPGGVLNLVPKQGTADFHGTVSTFLSTPGMSSGSVPSRLQDEGLFERTRLNSFSKCSARFSGPVFTKRLLFFATLSYLNLNRDVAEFDPDDKGTIASALVNLTYRLERGSFHLLWTGQTAREPTAGAGRDVPHSATLNRKNLYNVFQLIWKSRFRPGHYFELGAAFAKGNIHSEFQDGISAPHGLEVFQKIPSGAAASAGREDRTNAALQGKGQALFGCLSQLHHRLSYGLALRYADSSSKKEILGNIHLHFQGEDPFEIVRFNTPVQHKEWSFDTHLFVEDLITFRNLASFSFGLHLVSTRGRALGIGEQPEIFPGSDEEAGKIEWFNLAPRLSFSLPLLSDKSLTLRVSAGRYHFNLPLHYLNCGNPQALGGLAYAWTDTNQDRQFQPGEEGELLRREGPYYAAIDPELKRPHTDEYSVSLTKIFPGNFCLTLAGFYRETRQLVETLNIGVPFSAYSPVQIYDPGDDTIPGNYDDLYLTVYNQDKNSLGNDFYLLSNPDAGSRVSRYRGLDLILTKKFGSTVFFFAATATEAMGTSSPGNTEYENDDGVIGALYDNPNAFLFAKGDLRFDRAYTARLGVSIPFPFGFRLAGLAKYYDGQPFTRKIIVTGFNQGPFYVQAFPRGVARYEFNMTVDLRLEKAIPVGKTRVRFTLDAYNIFDWAMATEENEWTGPEFPLRYATEVQSPRVIRVGIHYDF